MITSETRTNNKNRLLGIFQIVAEMLSEVRCGTIWHSTRDIAIENVPPSSFAMLSEVLPAIIRHSRDAAIENVPPFSFAESRKVFWGVFCERFSALLLASKGACGPACCGSSNNGVRIWGLLFLFTSVVASLAFTSWSDDRRTDEPSGSSSVDPETLLETLCDGRVSYAQAPSVVTIFGMFFITHRFISFGFWMMAFASSRLQ
jgi:hypothetical protein